MSRPAAPEPRDAYRLLLRAFGRQGWWPVTVRRGQGPVYRPGFSGVLSEVQRAEVCVGAILTQNTAWTNVEKALKALHAAGLRAPAHIAAAQPRRLEFLVRSSGYFRQKAKKLKVFARHALSRRRPLSRWLAGPLPELREELLSLWGVGPETADSILLYAGARPVFVVDSYTMRIGRRVGWFGKSSYEKVQAFFSRRLPASAEVYAEFHALLVELAKRHCKTTPACAGCPLMEVCRHGRSAAPAS